MRSCLGVPVVSCMGSERWMHLLQHACAITMLASSAAFKSDSVSAYHAAALQTARKAARYAPPALSGLIQAVQIKPLKRYAREGQHHQSPKTLITTRVPKHSSPPAPQ